ncbi:MAG: hypothetical protein GEV11_18730 [Streptosporangiales bacterium]|nr:hypothetical protein [Streptosporangiales bacterium]
MRSDRAPEDPAGTGLSGAELMSSADRLLRGVGPGAADLWPRAAAFLLRAALEQALNELWARVEPRLLEAPRHAQLLVLPHRLDDVRAARAAFVWAALSNACHHHTYELAPTAAELRRWHTEVAELVSALEAA